MAINVTLTVINQGPRLSAGSEITTVFFNTIESQEIYIPQNFVYDPENQGLQFSLQLRNGSNLPAWISFDSSISRIILSVTANNIAFDAIQ